MLPAAVEGDHVAERGVEIHGCKQPLDEVSERYGFPTAAIVTMEEVTECLYNKEVQGKIIIDDALKAAIDSYYAQYGAKA